jgi:DNA-binding LacI/PurR family transcriptional regulator
MSRPTMEHVAALAGVSRALVSIVYRDAAGASDATRARVLAAGAELGYRPDHRARLLGRTKTRLLGVTFDVQAGFQGELVEALYTAAESAGYDLALSAVAPTRAEPRAVQSLLDYRCEALILLGPTLKPAALAALAESQPTVVVARKVSAPGVDVVRTDDTTGSRLAVEHLLALGHTSIAHLDGGKAPGSPERRTGYRNAMRAAGLTPLILPGGPTEDHGARAAKTFLEDAPTATAVTIFNDRSAVGFLDLIRQSRRIPDDLSVIGYDNTTVAALSHVGLTTIAQDTTRLATQATTTAIARLSGATTATTAIARLSGAPPTDQTIPPTLIPRTTTAPPP